MATDRSLVQERAALNAAANAVRRGEALLGDSLVTAHLLDWEKELENAVYAIGAARLALFDEPQHVADHLKSIVVHVRALRFAVEAGATDKRLKLNTRHAEQVIRAARAAVRSRCRQASSPLSRWRQNAGAATRPSAAPSEVSRGVL